MARYTPSVGVMADGTPIRIVLTRYRKDLEASGPPVVLIHGFSANGTTFTHPAQPMSLARYLCNRGRDVWVLDLRTSSGLPATARKPWTFEEVACVDIPRGFRFIRETRVREARSTAADEKIDVVAQCMGAAMLSMAILDEGIDVPGRLTPAERDAFVASIGSVVLSQISPMIVFTAANIFRAYSARYVQQVFGQATFELRPSRDLTSQLLDRLLASVPYPDGEFEIENPLTPWKRTSWVGSRHRLDAWFGRVFNASNIAPEVLDSIDDMFGPINLHTTFQTIHFARSGSITSRNGRNLFISPPQLKRWRNIPTLSIHGSKNGLSDRATPARMRELMRESGITNYADCVAEGFGHQDCLIGRDAPTEVFPHIANFLDSPANYLSQSETSEKPAAPAKGIANGNISNLSERVRVVDEPWLGPVVGELTASGDLPIAVASNPKAGWDPKEVVVAIVTKHGNDQQFKNFAGQLDHYPLAKSTSSRAPTESGINWFRTSIKVNWQITERALLLLTYEQFPTMNKPPWATWKRQQAMASEVEKGSAPASSLSAEQVFEPASSAIAGSGVLSDQFARWIVQPPTPPRPLAEAVKRFLRSRSDDELDSALISRPDQHTADPETLSFIHGSCQYPAGPLDEKLAADSYERMLPLLEGSTEGLRPDFLVLTGDQVYVDATAGLIDPSIKDDKYELPYERFFRTKSVRKVLNRLPAYMVLDDHEIEDNWQPMDGQDGEALEKGKAAYFKYQRALESPPASSAAPAWVSRTLRGFEFFFTDTRAERLPRNVEQLDAARIMHDKQFNVLLEWLSKNNNSGKPIFVVSPSILLPRRVSSTHADVCSIRSDAWDGYLFSFRRLLSWIVNNRIQNVIFLSGDEHHSCVATITLTPVEKATGQEGKRVMIHSIHSSALYAPFVFANGDPADLAGQETFEFPDPDAPHKRTIRCEVQTWFAGPSIGGFAVIECKKASRSRWRVSCEFKLSDGEKSFKFDVSDQPT